MITRPALADEIDRMDSQIGELQEEKREFYEAYRQQMENAGTHKHAIKAEIDACKNAIRRRQKKAKDPDAFEEKDALSDEVFVEITSKNKLARDVHPPHTRTRAAREKISPPNKENANEAAEDKPQVTGGGSDNDPLPVADGNLYIPDYLRRSA